MKKIFALSLSVLLCTVVFAGGTNDTHGASGIAVIKKSASTYNLIYKTAKAGDVKISILNSKHELVYNESIKTSDGFSRPYNFESLAEGEYSIEVVDENGIKIEKIHNYADKFQKSFHLTKVKDQKKFVLAVAGKGSEIIHVKIYDGSNALVFDEGRIVDGDFSEVFNLKTIKGAITFEVTGENGESIAMRY